MVIVRDVDLCIVFHFVQLYYSTLRKKHSSDAAFKEDGRGHRGSRPVSPTPLFGTECYCSALGRHSICTKLLCVFSQTCKLCVKKQ